MWNVWTHEYPTHFAYLGFSCSLLAQPTQDYRIVFVPSSCLNSLYLYLYATHRFNGDKLEFDKKGVWTEVNCKYSAVPVAVVPDAIKKYVTTNYPDAKMLKIERDKYDYEVKLSNGWEIKFDMQFNVIDIDN